MVDWKAKAEEFAAVALGNAARIGELEIELATLRSPRPIEDDTPTDAGEGSPANDDLARLIETRLLGVEPDSQDLVLDDFDWQRIIAALEAQFTHPTSTDTGLVGELIKQARYIRSYLNWTIGAESPGYHPTMPSAVAAFTTALDALSKAKDTPHG